MIYPALLKTSLFTSLTLGAFVQAQEPSCTKDLSGGALILFSGGPADGTNPPEVRKRMDEYIESINKHPQVQKCSNGKGLSYKYLAEQPNFYIHQSKWRQVCEALKQRPASPLVIVGHSNGGAAAVSLSRCLQQSQLNVDILITADSVGTTDDLGSVNSIPENVQYNINTFLQPNPITFTIPFPFGKANKRENSKDGAELKNITNISLNYLLPAAIAHRNAFYEFAGGDKKENNFSKPFVLYDLTVAYLNGANEAGMDLLLMSSLQTLSTASKIKIDVSTAKGKLSLKPVSK